MQRENRLNVGASLERSDALPAFEDRRKVEKLALLLIPDPKHDGHSNSFGFPSGAKLNGLVQDENRNAAPLDSIVHARMHIGNAWGEDHVGAVVFHRSNHLIHIVLVDEAIAEERARRQTNRLVPARARNAHLDGGRIDQVANVVPRRIPTERIGAQKAGAELLVLGVRDALLDNIEAGLAQNGVHLKHGNVRTRESRR